MLILLGTVVLLSTLTASGSWAQQPQDETGLFENVFGGAGKMAVDISEVPLPVQLALRTVLSEMTSIAETTGVTETTGTTETTGVTGIAFSDINITDVSTEIGADGELIYAVDFENPAAAAGRSSIDITSSGRVLQVEEAIAMEQLPPLVSNRMTPWMEMWMPNMRITEVWKSVRPDAIVFEVDGTDEQGNEIVIEIPEHGQVSR